MSLLLHQWPAIHLRDFRWHALCVMCDVRTTVHSVHPSTLKLPVTPGVRTYEKNHCPTEDRTTCDRRARQLLRQRGVVRRAPCRCFNGDESATPSAMSVATITYRASSARSVATSVSTLCPVDPTGPTGAPSRQCRLGLYTLRT